MATTLWYTRCPVPTALSIAIRNGWIERAFAPDGITVNSLTASESRSVRQSHFQQSQPNFFRHGGNTPPLFARSRGKDVRLIGLSFNESLRTILVRADSDIESIADLRGRRLSLPRRLNDSIDFWQTTVLRGFADILASKGLTLDDVVLTDVAIDRAYVDDGYAGKRAEDSLWGARFMLGHQREEALALARGEVDAIYSQGAIAAIVESFLGARAIFESRDTERWGNNDAPLVLTVTGDLLDERPDLVDRWLEQVLLAAQWAKDNEDAAKRIIACEGGIAEELVDRAHSPDIHRQLDVSLDGTLIARLCWQHDELIRRGFIDREVDFDRFIDFGPLSRVAGRLSGNSRTVAAA